MKHKYMKILFFPLVHQRVSPIRGRDHLSVGSSSFPLCREVALVGGRQLSTVDREPGGFEYVESSSRGPSAQLLAGGTRSIYALDPRQASAAPKLSINHALSLVKLVP